MQRLVLPNEGVVDGGARRLDHAAVHGAAAHVGGLGEVDLRGAAVELTDHEAGRRHRCLHVDEDDHGLVALKQMGILAIPPLLEALESEEADVRFAAFQVASAITRNPKISRDGPLWKSGKAEDRQKALEAWKEWYEKTKPQVPKQK